MQLVAMGAQDVFLTGNPQITFFKVVYRRHTNFSKECIRQEFNGSIPTTGNTSGNVTCTLARNGDLVQEIYLQATMNATDPTGISITADVFNTTNTITVSHQFSNGDFVSFNNSITKVDGTIIIEANHRYVVSNVATSVLTGAKTAFMLKELNGNSVTFEGGNYTVSAGTTVGKEGASLDKDLTNLINTVEVEIGGQKIDKHYSAWLDIYNELFEKNHDYINLMTLGTPGNMTTLYIPLRFWFNRNAGLALPLIALQYHEVKVLINLKIPADSTLISASLLVNYIYLDTDERRRFAQVSHEYLIEQVQHTGSESMTGSGAGKVDMNFNHPVKAIFWKTDGKNFLDNVKIQLNGHDRFSEQSANYFHLVQPYECELGHRKSLNILTRNWGNVVDVGETNSVGMYSFCLKPAEHQPSGSCNFSRIDNARLNYKHGKDGANNADTLHLFALNYNVLRIMSGMGGLTYSN